jgi:hypothetical protein
VSSIYIYRAKKKVSEQSNITELSDLRAAAVKELTLAESQLNGAVQGKLDALKRSVDLMEESTLKLAGFTETMNDVESKIQKTNTLIVTFPHIRKIQHARDNLNKVIAQVESFLNVPNRVAELTALLLENPDRIKDVFLEALSLEGWRRSLKSEINNSRDKKIKDAKDAAASGKAAKGALLTFQPTRSRKQSQVDQYSVEMLDSIDNFVDNHLGIILKLSTDVKNVIFGNIERLFDTASENPEELVATFEIIEMHQQYLERRLEQSLRRAVSEQSSCNPEMIGFEDLREQAARRLRNNLEQKIQAWFIISLQEGKDAAGGTDDQTLYQFESGEEVSVKMLLTAALDIMKRINTFRGQVVPCIPPSYNALEICMREFENQFVPYADWLLADVGKLDVYDLVQLVDWFDYFIGQMEVFELSDRAVCVKFSSMIDELMMQYLFTIKEQVMQWFGNIRNQPVEVVRSTEGILITSTPEDMFNIIHMQIAVAKDRLSRDHLKDVVTACLQVWSCCSSCSSSRSSSQIVSPPCIVFYCGVTNSNNCCIPLLHTTTAYYPPNTPCILYNIPYTLYPIPYIIHHIPYIIHQVLRDVQRQSYDSLRSGWREMHPEMLCAMVNDTQRMQEKSEEFAATVIRLIPRDLDREMLTAILEEVSSEYIAIAVQTVNFLARCILEDLEEASFSKLFKSEWESGEEAICPTITATLQDYFNDIKEWLQSYFYSRFVYECLTAAVTQYVMCLRRYHPGTLLFSGELSAAKRIFDDMEEMMRAFSEHIEVLEAGGLRIREGQDAEAALAACLAPMAQLARIISATHFSGATEEAISLFDRWGPDALQLVQCALSCNPSMDKTERAENLDAAEKLFNKKKYSDSQKCDVYRTVEGSLTGVSAGSTGVDGAVRSLRRTASTSAKDQVSKLSGWKFRSGKGKEKK